MNICSEPTGNSSKRVINSLWWFQFEAWKEDTRFIRYFQIPDDRGKKYIPDFEYILVDVNRLDDELLGRLKTEVSYFFLLDKTNLHEVEKASKRISAIFRELKNLDPRFQSYKIYAWFVKLQRDRGRADC